MPPVLEFLTPPRDLVTATVAAPIDLFEDAAIAMAYASLDGRILRVNEAMCDFLGRDRQELTSAYWEGLTHPDDLRSSNDPAEALLTGRQQRIDFQRRYLRPDGQAVTARATSALTTIDGRRVMFTQLHDMTDEAAAMAGVCAAERRFQALTSSSSDAVFWLQLHPEVRFTYINDAVASMTGYAAEEIYADPNLRHQIVHPDDQHLLQRIGSGAARLRWLHRDGSITWVEQRMSVLAETDGQVTDLLGVARDVTDRVESDHAWTRRAAQRTAASDLARRCVAPFDSEGIVRSAVEEVARHTDADAVAVWWGNGEDGRFRLAAGTGFFELTEGVVVDAVSSHAARVRANQEVTSFDRMSVLSMPKVGGELEGEGIEHGIGVPILSVGRVVGSVAAYSRTSRRTDPEDVLFIQTIAGTLGTCADQAQFADELRHAAAVDPLTGVLNRSSLLDVLSATLDTATDAPVVLAVCDIDDFRLLNEAQGSSAGDDALREVAMCLRSALGSNVSIGRTGGDEFAIVVPSSPGVLVASLAKQITDALAAYAATSIPTIAVTVSTGFASGATGDNASDMLAAALAALRDAQKRGRSQWSQASGHAHDEACRRLELTRGLRGAVSRGEIRAHFQPIVDLADGNIVGFEALARWERADGETVPPAEFIPIAEDTGDIHGIGLSILDQACSFLQAATATTSETDLMVTVNVSAHQLDDPQLPARIDEVLSRYRIPQAGVCLELTESTLVPGDGPMLARIHDLKRMGVRLALDDFGTGYSSFAYLTQFPIDLLKLDRAFVTDLQDDPRRASVARAVISLAHDLGITVLAEGIESISERTVLTELHCELGQGYLWSRPVPPFEASALLNCQLVETRANIARSRRDRGLDGEPAMALLTQCPCLAPNPV